MIKTFFQTIISIKNSGNHKVLTILGIKIKFKRKLQFLPYFNSIYYNELAKKIHPKVFEKYKNCHSQDSVVLFATGPSAQYYQPINSAFHLAINSAVLHETIKFDYIFIHDNLVYDRHSKILRNSVAAKFCAFHTNIQNAIENNFSLNQIEDINADRFIISDPNIHNIDDNVIDVINPDIANGYIYDRGGGTVFSALQFLLYTNPKKIYLVGCDCNNDGYFFGNEKFGSNYLLPKTIRLWKEASYLINKMYRNTEIISVNPAGLKGLFKDVYTQSYIDTHPELLKENIEIINEEKVNA